MEQVTITTSVNVKDGPLVKVASQLKSDAYVVASLALAKGATASVSVMPANGVASLMVIQATKDKDQADAKIEVTPEGTAAGTKLAVEGSLLVTNPAVLAGMAAGGPQKLTVKNVDPDDATVSILVAFDS